MTCKHENVHCVDSRYRDGVFKVRRYHCDTCGERFNTVEIKLDQVVRVGHADDYLESARKQLKIDSVRLKHDWLLELMDDLPKLGGS